MVNMIPSTAFETDIDPDGYVEILASEVEEGDLFKVNCAPDALVLYVDKTSLFQTIIEILHANGDNGSLSRNPKEKVKIRKRQGKA